MNLSSDDESSSDSGTEYIRPTDKIDLNSSLFKTKPVKRKTQDEPQEPPSDSDDDDEDLPTYTNTELLSQIMKNLEETNKALSIPSQTKNQISSDSGIDVKESGEFVETHDDSITNLLLQGEKKLGSSTVPEASYRPSPKKSQEQPVIQGNIEVVCPYTSDLLKRRGNKKKQDLQEVLRARLNKRLRANQLVAHKVGIVCWLSHGFYLNRLMNKPEILGTALSLVSPKSYPQGTVDKNYIIKFTVWFKQNFELKKEIPREKMNESAVLEILKTKKAKNEMELVLAYVATARAMGLNSRLVVSLSPPERIVKKDKLIAPNENPEEKKTVKTSKESPAKCSKPGRKAKKPILKGDGIAENSPEGISRKRMEAKLKAAEILKKINSVKSVVDKKEQSTKHNARSKLKGFEKSSKGRMTSTNNTVDTDQRPLKKFKKTEDTEVMKTDDESDDEVEKKSVAAKTVTTRKHPQIEKLISRNRKILSSDEEDEPKNEKNEAKAGNYWAEIYVEKESSWICVDVFTGKTNCPDEIHKRAEKPVLYVIAWNADGTIKDVTRRYCPRWLTVTRKQRVSEEWWDEAIRSYKEKKTAISKAEDEQLLRRELELPLPKTISECKGHPLYAIARHLLKFEALYPPDIVPLGYLPNGEAIYPRFCVQTLMSRQTWLKSARVVKPAQEPFKIVKSMPKYDRMTGSICKDMDLELFGKWQTDPYVPPVAKDGVVPRNEYGNVDLFKKCMLPKGTIHLDLPGLARVARKLNIDCAPAVVGFNFGGRGAMPATQGYVVCEEYEHVLRDAWKTEQVEAEKRAKLKREKTIYSNWKKIIKGLLIRKRLAYKYDVDDGKEESDKNSAPSPTKVAKH